MIPRIIHFIYFPWDEQHKLKSDENDFDHAPFFAMRRYAPDFEVRLWTYSKAKEFCSSLYPSVWDVVQKCPHPTMMVDILRWVVIHHFGGIYWQMTTTPLTDMNHLLPSEGKTVRLFTEFNSTPDQCRLMAAEPIRNGEPEEPIRVLNQVFSAQPKTYFIQKHIDLILKRNLTYTPRKDYDILFIGANAALSTSYDRFGKTDPTVELINLENSRLMLKWRYLGSWRKETRTAPIAAPTLNPPPAYCRLDQIPTLALGYHKWIKHHPHEKWLTQLDTTSSRTSSISFLKQWITNQGIRSVFEAPCGILQPVELPCPYEGGDPSRLIVHANQQQTKKADIRFRHVNMLYTHFPSVDLFVCPNFLEFLSFSEARRVLRRILASKPKFLALTGYSLLGETWDTALGDFRPLNLRLPPFQFPEPTTTLPFPTTPNGRPDRCLCLWKIDSLGTFIHQPPNVERNS